MTAVRTLRVGTRASRLARAQTDLVVAGLIGVDVEIVPVRTEGDRTDAPLAQIGGTGVFVSALRDALLDGRIDIAVHSFKDLPVASADGIELAAVPAREDVRDALVARDGLTLRQLPVGARVGTGSPRRAAQLRALRRGLEVEPIRGNVDTRLGLVAHGRLDAVVLALAGLRRIGQEDAVTEVIDPSVMLPAPAQGALAVECRRGDEATVTALRALDDGAARATSTAERAVLAALEAGCSAPIGVLGEIVAGSDGARLRLHGSVTALDGSRMIRATVTGAATEAELVGERLAAELLKQGAAKIEMMMESST
jgi:hydroxymethylbilane synthase